MPSDPKYAQYLPKNGVLVSPPHGLEFSNSRERTYLDLLEGDCGPVVLPMNIEGYDPPPWYQAEVILHSYFWVLRRVQLPPRVETLLPGPLVMTPPCDYHAVRQCLW